MSIELLDRYKDGIPGAIVIFEGAACYEDFATALVLNCGWHTASLVKVKSLLPVFENFAAIIA